MLVKNNSFYFDIGGYFEFHISDRLKDSSEEKKHAGLETWNYGPVFGLGISLPISNFRIDILPSYRLGIRELYSYMKSIYNRYFVLSMRVSF